MTNEKNKLKHWLEYNAFQIFLLLLRLLPLPCCVWLGRYLGRLAFRVLKSRRRLTLENLKEAQQRGFLPDTLNVDRIARQTWEHLGMLGSEFIYYSSRPRRVLKNVIVEGEEHLRRVLEQKRGLILATTHLGNWEIMGARLALAGYGVNSITKTQSNGMFDDFINQSRRLAGIKSIPKLSFLRPVIRAFGQNEIVSFFMDQNAGKTGIPLPVFGRMTSIPRGTAEFAIKTNTPVVFAHIIREVTARHRLVISGELKMIRSENYEADLAANTQVLVDLIQTAIQKHPEQWLWMHKLWETDVKV
jgi:KDO2-lipid IV(A) lauroyltransferase